MTPNAAKELTEIARSLDMTPAQTQLLIAYGQGDKTMAQDRMDMASARKQLLDENTRLYGKSMDTAEIETLTKAMDNNIGQAARADTCNIAQYLQPVKAWNNGLYARDTK